MGGRKQFDGQGIPWGIENFCKDIFPFVPLWGILTSIKWLKTINKFIAIIMKCNFLEGKLNIIIEAHTVTNIKLRKPRTHWINDVQYQGMLAYKCECGTTKRATKNESQSASTNRWELFLSGLYWITMLHVQMYNIDISTLREAIQSSQK